MSLYRQNNSNSQFNVRLKLPAKYGNSWWGSNNVETVPLWDELAHPSLDEDRRARWVNLNDDDFQDLMQRIVDINEIQTAVKMNIVRESNRYIRNANTKYESYKMILAKLAIRFHVAPCSKRLRGLQISRRPMYELVEVK